KMMGSHAIASLIRVRSKTVYYCAHLISLSVMMILFFAVYDFILLLASSFWFHGTFVGSAEPVLHSLRLYSLPVIVFHIWGVQVIGSVTIALIQLCIA
ncbi:hypothetical protein, partial [Paenibacillus popilliae]|uniref:hypothetical protein n=1 Tax=Paenibacillus popilliae TaxID=78057 RepID=UPI001F41AC66